MDSAQGIDNQNVAAAQVQTQALRPFQIRACDEGKRQKMKCSSHIDYPNPCERCQHRQQPCKFTGKPERTIKRQQYVNNLWHGFRSLLAESCRKRKQSATEGHRARDSAVSSPLISAATPALMTQSLASDQSLSQGMMLDINSRPVPRALDCYPEFSVPSLSSTIPTADPAAGSTSPLVLQGIEASPTEITEIFSLWVCLRHRSA